MTCTFVGHTKTVIALNKIFFLTKTHFFLISLQYFPVSSSKHVGVFIQSKLGNTGLISTNIMFCGEIRKMFTKIPITSLTGIYSYVSPLMFSELFNHNVLDRSGYFQ